MYLSFDVFGILIFCYLIGSIPFGLLISLLLKKNDPRFEGSKNIGATNIARTSGWKLGLLTLICDTMKGYIPIFFFDNIEISINFLIILIFFGHLFPIWLKFKGGKGIAVLIGCLLAYNILYGLIFVLIWLIVAIISKYSSLSALCASSAVLTIMYYEKESLTFIMFIIVTMIFAKHLSNIKRLLSGKESKIVLKK